MKEFWEVFVMMLLVIAAIILFPLVIYGVLTLLELVFGLLLGGIILAIILGVATVPLALLFLFFRWFYRRVTNGSSDSSL
jgi:uncharacterized BrkB/YihY/UPF0761 family membrane protein